MTIEELALATNERKHTLKSERTYSNIRKMRNEVLMRGFLRQNTDNVYHSVGIVSGVEYIDATNVKNINSAWLLFSKSPKNIVWILNKGEITDRDISSISKNLEGKIKQIFLVDSNKESIEENISMASQIATSDDCVVLTSFDKEKATNEIYSKIFASKIFAM